jgi:chromosome segregation ATPase
VQAGSQLETVVRAEIQSRIEAVRKLRDEAAAERAALRGAVARAEQKTDLVLEAQRALNGKHDALRGEHAALAERTAADAAAARKDAASAVAAARGDAETRTTQLQDALQQRTEALETMIQDGVTDLEEDTRQKLTQTWDALTKSIDTVRGDLAAARTELATADGSVMDLVRAVGDKLDVFELTEVPEMNAQLDEIAATMVQEQESIRRFVEESLKVRVQFVFVGGVLVPNCLEVSVQRTAQCASNHSLDQRSQSGKRSR